MLVFRPIAEADLAGLQSLADRTGGGLTSLPADQAYLADRIEASRHAFRPRVLRPGGETYLFALEDSANQTLAGVAGIASRVGGYEPWYTYEIRPERHAHPPLGIERTIPTLHLRAEHRGSSEICSLFLAPERRRGGAGRLLSLARFLFIAAHRERFTATIVAEMRGYQDDAGRAPFWEAVGHHFFQFDYYHADLLSGLGEKEFIADLMPRHPIYIPLLPPDVQAVIGRVHRETEPALALLRAEGFAVSSEVDIFDAGPILRAETATIRTLRTAARAPVRSAASDVAADREPCLLANGALDFRACLGGMLRHDDGSVSLSRAVASALNVEPGETVWWAPLR
ncbi:MAG: arginine N-succinyltransferase [Opitutaceae bacterium]|nr:arginine N-succinyltransferase [Opitutaceae bacterium]